jgi:hypothetical protein
MIECYTGPEAMAKTLLQYISDDAKVQREVQASLGVKLHLSSIKEWRHGYNYHKAAAKRMASRPADKTLVDSDKKHLGSMAKQSAAFASRILEAGRHV